ncbi:hypothetical protein G3I34_23015 [Streptomyces sp. SID8014]|uniref:hypothetical protein n=1 Tax=Streptomyces sp. SID8014 TaxID=2706097 RepID=UPI0013BB37A0|nr:hypothetical protein [Streptomyces sp. SID8014]NEC15086.1 hypothetical protein [Streptomyces sp. SID8014]
MTTISPIRYADTGSAALVPLLADPATGRIRSLDLEVTPHLFIASGTGRGATSALRLVAAHTAHHGWDVQIIAPKRGGFPSLESAGLPVHRDPEDIAQAVTGFAADMEDELEALDGRAPTSHRLLVVDGLSYLRKIVVGVGSNRRSGVAALERVATLGRAAGYHLAVSASPSTAAMSRTLQDCSAVLALAPLGTLTRTALLGAGPRIPVPGGPGGGEFADYDGPLAVRAAYLTETEAHQLITG